MKTTITTVDRSTSDMGILDNVDTDLETDKETYAERLPWLKTGMRDLQQLARERNVPVVIVFEGWDTAGKGDAIQHVTEVLDPRGFVVHYISPPEGNDFHDPWMKRFWKRLPHRGQIAIFERSWYTRVLQRRVEGDIPEKDWRRAYGEIRRFERMLADDGYLIIKFWLHITEKDQRKRLKAAKKDPFHRYVVSDSEWGRHGRYSEYYAAAEEMLGETESEHAPWTIVPAGNKRTRRLTVLEEVDRQIEAGMERLAERPKSPPSSIDVKAWKTDNVDRRQPLEKIDLTHSLTEEEYRRRVKEAQLRLRIIQQEAHRARVGVAIVYEGWDAAGKGGNIRRLTATLDPRGYEVVPVSKPTPEEHAQHYLWRFWTEMPRRGFMTIFDRSWYGRILVERIEGFCTVEEAKRAPREINEMELELVNERIVVVKFWIHISAEEQLRRFESRQQDPHKAWKMTDEDWRNREKWEKYLAAVNDMIRDTHTSHAPWTVISGECKRWARLQAIEAVCNSWENAIG